MSTVQDIDSLMQRFARKTVPGCSLIVMQHGETLYEGYHGYADLENRSPITEDSMFRLYSMTKVIVCTAAMMLFERGKILLTEPVSEYLPEFNCSEVAEMTGNGSFILRKASRPIEIRDCLNMSCGLGYPIPSNINHPTDRAILEYRERLENAGTYTLRDEIKELAKVPLRFDPGTHFAYGLGHDIIAAIIEEVSGKTIGEFLKAEIFEPLEMRYTAYRINDETKNFLVKCYDVSDEYNFTWDRGIRDDIYQPDSIYEGGGAGLLSNTKDYAAFTQMLANGGIWKGYRLLGKRTIDLMRTNILSETGLHDFWRIPVMAGYGYGLGVRTMMFPAGISNTPVGEFGWAGVAGTWMSVDPDDGFSVVYMHNTFPSNDVWHNMRIRAAAYGLLQ